MPAATAHADTSPVEVRGDEHDSGWELVAHDDIEHLSPVQLGHFHVEHGDVRLEQLDALQGIAAATRLADQLEIWRSLIARTIPSR